ncbi:MAG: UDP-N-acetylmuramoyl-L-alanine--D-glutamate ligase [Bacteroidota bacterium]
MKKLVVLGAGESGVGAAILGQKEGFEVWVSDKGKIQDRYKQVLEQHNITFEEGQHTKEKFFDAEVIVKSPGIPEKVPIIQTLRAHKIPIISEIEFAARYTDARIVAITGSNGKTTTTTLIYHLLAAAGLDVGLGGNIGKSFALQVAQDPRAAYVLEISSFQLDDIERFQPEVALLLNITPDHLDRYGYQLEAYGAAKMRITENQTPDQVFILNGEDAETQRQLGRHALSAQVRKFGLQAGKGIDAWIAGDALMLKGNHVGDFRHLRLLGRHNQLNVLAALLAVQAFGVDVLESAVQMALRQFSPIEHRLEEVAEVAGVQFINDSKATNVDAVFYALEAMNRPTIWMAGGVDKGNDYTTLQPWVREKVKAIVVLGEHDEKFHKDFSVPVYQVASMQEGVSQAVRLADAGDAVLLSPACASFDLFQNYEDRGRQFKAAVKEWATT